jgi:hypothetical protein
MNKPIIITPMHSAEVFNFAAKILWLLAIAAIAALLSVGCKATTASYDPKSGAWKVSDRRLLLRTEAEITASVDTNGTKSVNIKAKSDPAAEAIKAAAEGAAAGVAKGLKP